MQAILEAKHIIIMKRKLWNYEIMTDIIKCWAFNIIHLIIIIIIVIVIIIVIIIIIINIIVAVVIIIIIIIISSSSSIFIVIIIVVIIIIIINYYYMLLMSLFGPLIDFMTLKINHGKTIFPRFWTTLIISRSDAPCLSNIIHNS